MNVLTPKSQTINLSEGFSSVLHRTESFQFSLNSFIVVVINIVYNGLFQLTIDNMQFLSVKFQHLYSYLLVNLKNGVRIDTMRLVYIFLEIHSQICRRTATYSSKQMGQECTLGKSLFICLKSDVFMFKINCKISFNKKIIALY